MLTIKEARKLLGEAGQNMNDKKIEQLTINLYSLINQLLDNYFSKQQLCKKH